MRFFPARRCAAIAFAGVGFLGGCSGETDPEPAAVPQHAWAPSPPPMYDGELCDVPEGAIVAAPRVSRDTGTIERVSNGGEYVVTCMPSPDPIPLNDMFTMEVRVASADGSCAAEDVSALSVSAWMPDHAHGLNVKPRIEPLGDGRFTVSGMRLHMPGYWQVYLDAMQNGIVERTQFDVWFE